MANPFLVAGRDEAKRKAFGELLMPIPLRVADG